MSVKKVHIASSRPIGKKCFEYAERNLPEGFVLCRDWGDCDIFISVMYDTLLKESFLKGRKCFNFHPGILPHYRGSGAFTWSIINGEKSTGITLHEIDKDIDTGPIITVREFDIDDHATAYDLFETGMDCIYDLFVENFENILKGNYHTQKFPKIENCLYTRKMLDSAKDITDLVRAFTFLNKEGVYYYTRDGRKIYLEPFKDYENE
jgi:methionyl-tRNA formyltransferase